MGRHCWGGTYLPLGRNYAKCKMEKREKRGRHPWMDILTPWKILCPIMLGVVQLGSWVVGMPGVWGYCKWRAGVS